MAKSRGIRYEKMATDAARSRTRILVHGAAKPWPSFVCVAVGVALLTLEGNTSVAAQALWMSAGRPDILRVAERGNARAQTRLGFMYATGQRVPQNLIAAVYWYHRAAEQGDPDAQYLLGICYDTGRGVSVDRIQAHKWMNLSASQSAGGTREHRARMRDIIASKLSNEQVAIARELALMWRSQRE